jgi:hypothetical protein
MPIKPPIDVNRSGKGFHRLGGGFCETAAPELACPFTLRALQSLSLPVELQNEKT